jgi:protein TonB
MTRRSGLVIFSVVAHALILCVIVVASVMATGIIPTPFDRVTFEMQNAIKVADIKMPVSPPAHAPAPVVESVNAAPIEAPSAIVPEAALPPAVPATTALSGADAGALFGPATATIEAPPPPPPPPVAAAPPTPMRLSTGVTPPRRIAGAEPVYPLVARTAHIEGIVIIEAVIGTDGRVESARVLRGVQLLDDAALEAVRQWRYTPGMLNGAAVPIIMTVTVNFSLSGR